MGGNVSGNDVNIQDSYIDVLHTSKRPITNLISNFLAANLRQRVSCVVCIVHKIKINELSRSSI